MKKIDNCCKFPTTGNNLSTSMAKIYTMYIQQVVMHLIKVKWFGLIIKEGVAFFSFLWPMCLEKTQTLLVLHVIIIAAMALLLPLKCLT